VLGQHSGGLIARLLGSYMRSHGREDNLRAIANAHAQIEEASTKVNPREWISARVVR